MKQTASVTSEQAVNKPLSTTINHQIRLGLLEGILLRKRIKMQGFIIFDDYASHYPKFVKQMTAWVKQGKIKFLEDMTDGLENAPEAFIGLLKGKNFGKSIVRMSQL